MSPIKKEEGYPLSMTYPAPDGYAAWRKMAIELQLSNACDIRLSNEHVHVIWQCSADRIDFETKAQCSMCKRYYYIHELHDDIVNHAYVYACKECLESKEKEE